MELVALSGDGKTMLIGASNQPPAALALREPVRSTRERGTWHGPTELSLGKKGNGGDLLGFSAALSANGHEALLGALQRGTRMFAEVFTLNGSCTRRPS